MSRNGAVGVGLIGTGMISNAYLENLTAFPDIRVVALGDLDTSRARSAAEQWNVPVAGTPETVLTHPDVEIVVNLTIPAAHAAVATSALDAGKHVWSEKPIGISRDEATALLAHARKTGLRVGVAPDTILGPGIQTALRAIRSGAIGEPLTAKTVLQYVGPDIMHPSPEFLFAPGAGPLFDMGPYYFTTLVCAFGPFSRVGAVGSTGRATRKIRVGERAGTEFPVDVPTSVGVLAQFETGAFAQSTLSFETPLTRNGVVEITGTEGTIVIPDPNKFTGEIKIFRAPTAFPWPTPQPFESIEPVGPVTGRGLGVLDMARSIRADRPHVATGELGAHVLDALVAVDESIRSGEFVTVSSTTDAVGTLDATFDPYIATL